MSLVALETQWKKALSSILEELTKQELNKLLFSLDKIPQGQKAEVSRERLPDLIVQHYGTEGSISAINKEMKLLPRNDARVQEPLQTYVNKVKQLKKKLQETKGSVKKPKPASGTTSTAVSASGSVNEPKPASGTTSTAVSASGSVNKPKPASGTTSTAVSASGSVNKPKPASGQVKSCPDEKAPGDAVQTVQLKITGVKSSNTRNTHLEVEVGGELMTPFVTTSLLEKALGFRPESPPPLPLSAGAQIQGNKITALYW